MEKYMTDAGFDCIKKSAVLLFYNTVDRVITHEIIDYKDFQETMKNNYNDPDLVGYEIIIHSTKKVLLKRVKEFEDFISRKYINEIDPETTEALSGKEEWETITNVNKER